MKTNLLFRFAALAAALAALACSADDTAPQPAAPDHPDQTAPYTITAAFDDQTPENRVSMTDDGATKITLKWKAGDKIYVVNSNAAGSTSDGTLYTFTAVAGSISQDGKSASFTCETFPKGATPAFAWHQGDISVSYFNPTNIALPSNFNKQNLQNIFPLYAAYDAETAQFSFRPIFALLKLKITPPADASGSVKIRINLLPRSEIFYNGGYNITSGTAVRSGAYNEPDYMSYLHYNGYLSLTEGTESVVYLPIRPGAELVGKQLEIDVSYTNAAYSASIRGAALEAGKCYPLTLGAAKWSGGRIYEGGTGSEGDPYQLENETNLRALARSVRAGNSYSGAYFRLTKSVSGIVTSKAEPWRPIGTQDMPFNGHFDGGGNTVSGTTFYLSDNYGVNLGFFGYTGGGSIRNLTIDGDISYQSEQDSHYMYIGGIVGTCDAELTGCTHTGALSVENTVTSNATIAGGIVGQINNNISACTQSSGTITINAPNGSVRAGGIAGHFNIYDAVMHTCRNESDLIVTGKSNSIDAGALVGDTSGMVYDCSTFRSDLTVTVNGTPQNPVKAIGYGYPGRDQTQPCDGTAHTAQQ